MVKSIDDLRQDIENLRKRNKSWSEVVAILYPQDPNKKGMRPLLYRVAYDEYIPQGNRVRNRLGLPRMKRVTACAVCNEVHTAPCPKQEPPVPPNFRPAPVCNECGEVHLRKTCPRRKARKRKPRYRPDLPPDTTPEQRERISKMSPQERLERMLR